MNRIVGVDTARGLAVLGMFVAHLGMERHVGLLTPTGWFFLADGRPSALFAVLAGTGLAFMTRSAYPGDRAQMAVQRRRIVKRSAALFVLGYVLMFLMTPVAVILPSYAVLFILGLPFLRARVPTLLAWATAVLLVMPQVVLLGRRALLGTAEPRYDVPPIGELVTGYYPALSWLAYLLVGLAVGRLALRTLRVQLALLLGGALLAVVGHGTSDLLLRTVDAPYGSTAYDLLSTEPHADTTFEIAGNLGFAVAVIGLCLLLTTALDPVRVLLTPVSATGSMSLSVYSLHIVVIALMGADAVYNPASNTPLLLLVLGTLVLATAWQLTLGRGPLERALSALIRPRGDRPEPPRQLPPQRAPWPQHQHRPRPGYRPEPAPVPPATDAYGPYPAAPPPR